MKLLFCITSITPGRETASTMRAFAATDRDLIEFADVECSLLGGPSLAERAGIEELQCYHEETGETAFWPQREWKKGEELATALQVFRKNDQTFLIFDSTKKQDRQNFLREAEARGCGAQARECLEEIAA